MLCYSIPCSIGLGLGFGAWVWGVWLAGHAWVDEFEDGDGGDGDVDSCDYDDESAGR